MRTGVVWCATTACVSRRASAADVSCSLTHFGANPQDAPSCPQHRNRCSNACMHDCAPRIKSKFMNRLTQRRARRQPRHAGGGSGEGTASSCRRDKGTKTPLGCAVGHWPSFIGRKWSFIQQSGAPAATLLLEQRDIVLQFCSGSTPPTVPRPSRPRACDPWLYPLAPSTLSESLQQQ